MYQIRVDDDFGYYGCEGEFDKNYYSEFNGKIYIYDSEVRIEEIEFYYKVSKNINNKEISDEQFSFTVASVDIASFSDGFGLISFFDIETNATFTSLCKFESITPEIDFYRQVYPPDFKPSVKNILHISLFSGLVPSELQRDRFQNFFDNVDEFSARIEDSKNSLYEKNWRFKRGWISSEIQRCVRGVNSYFDNSQVDASQWEIDGVISKKEIELIMQAIPFWVAGEMVKFAKVGATESEFMNWLRDQNVSQALVSHHEILKVYLVMCGIKKVT